MSKQTLLFVEDHVQFHKLFERIFRDKYDLIFAFNGEEALRRISHKIPDLIISDISMPIMDGKAFKSILQKDARTKRIPFIFLTVHPTEMDRTTLLRSGIDDYIPKPFHPFQLRDRVDALLERLSFYMSNSGNNRSLDNLKIFLCHANEDKKMVFDLYQKLKNTGADPWLDDEKLKPGQHWEYEIENAIRSSHIVAVCLSTKSCTKEGYVQREIHCALKKEKEIPEGAIYIIPIKLEECTVPKKLHDWHWVNLYEEKGFDKLLRALQDRAAKLRDDCEVNVQTNSVSNWNPLIKHWAPLTKFL